jgi:hypothetical protein
MSRLIILGIAVLGVMVSIASEMLTLVSRDVSGIFVSALAGIPSLVLAYLFLKKKSAKTSRSS